MLLHEEKIIPVGTVDANGFGRVVVFLFAAEFELDGAGEVDPGDGIVSPLNVSIDSRFGNRQMMGHDGVVDVLPVFNVLRYDT